MLNLAVADNSGVAIAYDMLMRNHIAQSARQRRADIDHAHLLSKESEDIKKQVLAQRIADQKPAKEDKQETKKVKG